MAERSGFGQGFGMAVGLVFGLVLMFLAVAVGCPLVCATGTGMAIVGAAKTIEEQEAERQQLPSQPDAAPEMDAEARPLNLSSVTSVMQEVLSTPIPERQIVIDRLIGRRVRWQIKTDNAYKFNKKKQRRWITASDGNVKLVCEFASRPAKEIREIKGGDIVVFDGVLERILQDGDRWELGVAADSATIPNKNP